MAKHHYKRFDSVTDLFAAATDDPAIDRAVSRKTGDPDFYGSADWAQAKDYALAGGWEGAGSQAADAVASVLSTIRKTVQPQPVRVYANSGAFPAVALAIAGNPAHMIRPVPDPAAGRSKTVRIMVNIGALGFIDGETMVKRGIAYVALCEVLASLGYSTDVWCVSTCEPSSGAMDRLSVAWNVKAAGGVIDRDRLVFNLANPANLRRMAWSIRETMPEPVRKRFGISPGGGYGRSTDVDSVVIDDLRPDVVADAALTDPRQVPDPVSFVLKTLRGLDLIG
jgi:hypothetical protein